MGMRITYRTLASLIGKMNPEQLDSDVTIELYDGEGSECYAAHLLICNNNHDSLDGGHPVIYCDTAEYIGERRDDIEQIAADIGL